MWRVIKDPDTFPIKFCLMTEQGQREMGVFNLMGIATYKYTSPPQWCSLLRECGTGRWRIGKHVGNGPHQPIFEGTAWEVAVWVAVHANMYGTGKDAPAWVFPFDYKEDAP